MATMIPAELASHRANTRAFIAANFTMIELIPRTRVSSGTGARFEDGTPRPPQKLRLIDQTRTFGPEPGTVLASDGRQRKAEYQLLGEHDAVMGKYDYWVDEAGIRCEIIDIVHDNGYEKRAQVIRYGEEG